MQEYPLTFLSKLDTIIETNLHNEDFSIALLCKKLAISYTHTYRKIRAQTGLSPSMYVCQKRLWQACFLLENTELNMQEIAFRIGFNTQAYFSKCFMLRYGYPPSKFRKNLNKHLETWEVER